MDFYTINGYDLFDLMQLFSSWWRPSCDKWRSSLCNFILSYFTLPPSSFSLFTFTFFFMIGLFWSSTLVRLSTDMNLWKVAFSSRKYESDVYCCCSDLLFQLWNYLNNSPSSSPPPSFSSKWRDLQLTGQMIELFTQLESDWFNSKRMDRWNSFVCFIQLLHSFQFDQLNALSYWELIRSLVWLIWNSTLCQFKILKIIQNTWNCSS